MTDQRKRMPRPLTVSGLLAELFQGKPLGRRLHEGKIWQVWDEAVGPQIATRARPVKFREGVLTVTVDSAPWLQQLSFLKSSITEKLNTLLGRPLVEEIFLKAGRPQQTSPPPSATPSKSARKLTPSEEDWISQQVSSVQDPEVRRALADLMGRHLQNRPPGS